MGFFEIIILAVVQGLTEFLPVSSSGHLVVASAILESLGRRMPADLIEVNIVLHLGTLLAVVVFYFRELLRLATSDRGVVPILVIGTIPAAVIGIPLKRYGSELLEDPLLAGAMFPVTVLLLVWASRTTPGSRRYQDFDYRDALAVGSLQALALLPGVSRSGATIAGGIARGLDRLSAGTFAFLLAVPAIGGAGVLEGLEMLEQSQAAATASGAGVSSGADVEPLVLLVGAAVSTAVGWLALAWLIRWVRAGRLALFAWYLIPLGVAVVVWRLTT